MALAYPSSVPSLIQAGSFKRTIFDSVFRLKTDIGKQMTRNKYTGEFYLTSFRIQMNTTELEAFFIWYNVTLNKVLSFNFPEPISGELIEYTFLSPPDYTHIGIDQFVVSYSLKNKLIGIVRSPINVNYILIDSGLL